MAEYIILTIIFILIILSFMYLVKGIKSISIDEKSIIFDNNILINKKLLLENNLDELEFDLLSQKLDKEEYDKLKENMLNDLSSINKLDDPQTSKDEEMPYPTKNTNGDKKNKIICINCKKELEIDSKFCKYCGNKVNL